MSGRIDCRRPAVRKTSFSYCCMKTMSTLFTANSKAITVLIVWFFANVFITIYSKSLYKDQNFPFPLLLTAIHFAFTSVMAVSVWLWRKYHGGGVLPVHEDVEALSSSSDWWKRCIMFTIIFTTNIWLSNYSLLVVTIQVHQIIRTTIPLMTMFFSWALFNEKYSMKLLPSVLLVVLGVLVSVWSDRIAIGVYGLTVVTAGCVFSSLKGIMTRNVQLHTDTIDVLRIVCPISVVILIVASIGTGEFSNAYYSYSSRLNHVLFLQGVTAALLNYVSFKCASLNSPLTMNIAGNVKQVVTPLIATPFIHTHLTPSGTSGLLLAFIGAVCYTLQINRPSQIRPQNYTELQIKESNT